MPKDEPRIPIEIDFDNLVGQLRGWAMIEAAQKRRARLYWLFGLRPPPDTITEGWHSHDE